MMSNIPINSPLGKGGHRGVAKKSAQILYPDATFCFNSSAVPLQQQRLRRASQDAPSLSTPFLSLQSQ